MKRIAWVLALTWSLQPAVAMQRGTTELGGAFVTGGYILGAGGAINNTNFTNERVLQTGWVGVRYSITSALDITGAYYHEWQNSFATGANGRSGGLKSGSISSLAGSSIAVTVPP